jgi:hypothetical protein
MRSIEIVKVKMNVRMMFLDPRAADVEKIMQRAQSSMMRPRVANQHAREL